MVPQLLQWQPRLIKVTHRYQNLKVLDERWCHRTQKTNQIIEEATEVLRGSALVVLLAMVEVDMYSFISLRVSLIIFSIVSNLISIS